MEGKTNAESRGMIGVVNAVRKESEEVTVAQAILAVTKAMESVPEPQIPNVFSAVKAIYDTARGKPPLEERKETKDINVPAEMKEIAAIREQLESMRRDQARQEKANQDAKRRGWFGIGRG